MRELKMPHGGSIIENTGNLSGVGEYVRKAFPNAKKALLVTDDNISKACSLQLLTVLVSLQRSGFEVASGQYAPRGEAGKIIGCVERMGAIACREGLHRGDVFISFGGGIVTDTVGLCAALYMRGANLCHIPTTIVAQCDAAVGGKCGVNLMKMKNRLGTFYHPGLVYIDTDLLSTLPEREMACGMAEVIKYGAIADAGLFKSLYSDNFDMSDTIMRCLEIKCAYVAEDERDRGARHALNFGHTVGHAIEERSGYKYSHGEGVAIGMYYMAKVGERIGITESGTSQRIAQICAKYGLDTAYEDTDYISYIDEDKKSEGDTINAVFLRRIGESTIEKINTKELKRLLYEEH